MQVSQTVIVPGMGMISVPAVGRIFTCRGIDSGSVTARFDNGSSEYPLREGTTYGSATANQFALVNLYNAGLDAATVDIYTGDIPFIGTTKQKLATTFLLGCAGLQGITAGVFDGSKFVFAAGSQWQFTGVRNGKVRKSIRFIVTAGTGALTLATKTEGQNYYNSFAVLGPFASGIKDFEIETSDLIDVQATGACTFYTAEIFYT